MMAPPPSSGNPPPSNPAPSILQDADWRRLSPRARRYAGASFGLLDTAAGHLRNGDLRQASEMGWGAAAQIIKAAAYLDRMRRWLRHPYPPAGFSQFQWHEPFTPPTIAPQTITPAAATTTEQTE